ncbi:MAG: DUF302 domain-containing protein [Candidatus Eremiobacteraeota bacterium]|nr:DUF302 domain-containing protein [Candidatus Eremiobacteraeota bacterium]
MVRSGNQNPAYGSAVETILPFEQAVAKTKDLLKDEGFGVLCEIDIAKTLKEKIGVQTQPSVILGACNPQLAYRALQEERYLGLLLPCNIVVQERDGKVTVAAIDVNALLKLTANPSLDEIAGEVQARLARVLDALKTHVTAAM